MKKIINGKLYNTETAKSLGCHSNGRTWRDHTYCCETLYIKRTGEYFLHGEGGAASRYAVSCGQNTWSGGETIEPLTYENAKNWAEKNLDADEYIAIFGPVAEADDERTTMTISLDAATAERIRREAQAAGTSVSALIASKF